MGRLVLEAMTMKATDAVPYANQRMTDAERMAIKDRDEISTQFQEHRKTCSVCAMGPCRRSAIPFTRNAFHPPVSANIETWHHFLKGNPPRGQKHQISRK